MLAKARLPTGAGSCAWNESRREYITRTGRTLKTARRFRGAGKCSHNRRNQARAGKRGYGRDPHRPTAEATEGVTRFVGSALLRKQGPPAPGRRIGTSPAEGVRP